MFVDFNKDDIPKIYSIYNDIFKYYYLMDTYNEKLIKILSNKLKQLNTTMHGDPLYLRDDIIVFNLYHRNFIYIKELNAYTIINWERLSHEKDLKFQFLYMLTTCLFEYTHTQSKIANDVIIFNEYALLERTYKANNINYSIRQSTCTSIIFNAFKNKIRQLNLLFNETLNVY